MIGLLIRLRQAGLAIAAMLAPWTLSAALVISLTASAGENSGRKDLGFRRSTLIEPQRLTLLPPAMPVLSLRGNARKPDETTSSAADWRRLKPHIRPADLARETSLPAEASASLYFLDDPVVFMPRALEPPVSLASASEILLARLHRFGEEGLTPEANRLNDTTLTPEARRLLTRARPDGATPGIDPARLRAAQTPAATAPEIIAAAAMRIPAFAHVHSDASGGKAESTRLTFSRGYLDLVDPASLQQETKCLAEAIYFEARSEPPEGQAAVAQVVLNRVASGLYPTNICGVVYQNRHRYKACQFTFACEGRSLAIHEPEAWGKAERIAKAVLAGTRYNPDIATSTHYHAEYVAPYWSRRLKKTEQIGRHIFYRLRPGQT
ncbi:MAG: cell wall hydrolase [Proteobacteria bacterium]|nr:cell wall hydrolase [Pseudomonadota bacterium]